MRRPALGVLSDAPVTILCAIAVVLFLVWTQDDAGQAIGSWAPGALLVLALLAVAIVAVPDGWRAASQPTRLALLLLAAFTAWSYASIAWAGDTGAAWDGANRTLLYLALFALFALWRQSEQTATGLLGLWVGGMTVLALAALLRIPGVADPASLFIDDRLDEPTGYPSAAACTWLMVFWPAIALAAARPLHWVARGGAALAAVIAADLALLSLSRGSMFALPLSAILFFAAFPGRLRSFAVLLPVALAAAAAAPAVLDVGPVIAGAADPAPEVNAMVRAVLLAAIAAATVVALGAFTEERRFRGIAGIQWRRVFSLLAVLTVAGLAGGGLAVAGNPVDRVQSGWDSFKGGGYSESGAGSRLASGLGSNRYDFYRVSLDLFRDEPIHGIGADNYFEDYLAVGRSDETPRYPHSLVFRTLSQTGIVGSLLLLGFVALAFGATIMAARRCGPLGAATASGAAMAFGYWAIHGSADWFWEFAGLGGPAFALLGLACSLGSAQEPARWRARGIEPPRARGPRAARASALTLVVAGCAVVTLPWLAERDVSQAAGIFATRPLESYERLDRAAEINPLSDRADLVAGSIALRYGDLARADRHFGAALERVPDGAYATLQLAAIASERGDRTAALGLLARAHALAPRDPLTRVSLRKVRAGEHLDTRALSAEILRQASVLTN